jgi:hypothetical protein
MLWNENECEEKTKIMRTSTQQYPVQVTIDQKRLNLKYFNYLGSTITMNARSTCKIKSKIATATAEFNKKKSLFTSKFTLNLCKKTGIALYGAKT